LPGAIEVVVRIGGIRVRRRAGENAVFFSAGMAIDADGAPRAFHRKSSRGLDDLANAGEPGNWWALVTDAGGEPLVQGAHDPAPGFYISTTALEDRTRRVTDPRRYVDASAIRYIVLPPRARDAAGIRLGDLATVRNRRSGKVAHAIFADIGPPAKLGEGSIALARALGIPHDPRQGGQVSDVVYLVFPRSGNGRPRPPAELDRRAETLLERWGGMARLEQL
jgi:Fungal chitosanase of glycosyl hydrolase group 75